jgi:hypothetical protein
MKVVSVNDYEWWAGESVEACVKAAMEISGCPAEEFEDAYELDDEQLDRLQFQDGDENEQPVGTPRSFRAQLAIVVAEGGNFPQLFACTEY